jgi:lambda repressor-like predicted transcriptional regulator
VQTDRLRYEMTRRGWGATDLAREARLSHATVSTALAGHAITAKSLSLIAEALSRVPPSDVIDNLIHIDRRDHGINWYL